VERLIVWTAACDGREDICDASLVARASCACWRDFGAAGGYPSGRVRFPLRAACTGFLAAHKKMPRQGEEAGQRLGLGTILRLIPYIGRRQSTLRPARDRRTMAAAPEKANGRVQHTLIRSGVRCRMSKPKGQRAAGASSVRLLSRRTTPEKEDRT
jgi:hypothetical protein